MATELKQSPLLPSLFPDIERRVSDFEIKENFIFVVGISIEKEDFKGIKLEGIVQGVLQFNKEKTNKYKIKKAMFLLPDTLLRHNRQVYGEDAITAFLNSKKIGAKWKLENLATLHTLDPLLEIREWDDDIFKPEVKKALHYLYSLSQSTCTDDLTKCIGTILTQATKLKEAQQALEKAEHLKLKETTLGKPSNIEIDALKADLAQQREFLFELLNQTSQNNELFNQIVDTVISQAFSIDTIKETIKALVLLVINSQANNNSINDFLQVFSDFQLEKPSIYNEKYYEHFQELELEGNNESDTQFNNIIETIKIPTLSKLSDENKIKVPSKMASTKLRQYPLEELAHVKQLSEQHFTETIIHAYPYNTGGKTAQKIREAVNFIFSKESKRNVYTSDIVDRNHPPSQKLIRMQQGKNQESLSSTTKKVQNKDPAKRHSDSEITGSMPPAKPNSIMSKKHSSSAEKLPDTEKLLGTEKPPGLTKPAENVENNNRLFPRTKQQIKQKSDFFLFSQKLNADFNVKNGVPVVRNKLSQARSLPTVTSTAQIKQLLTEPTNPLGEAKTAPLNNAEQFKSTPIPVKETGPPIAQETLHPLPPPQNIGIQLYSDSSFVDLACETIKKNQDLAIKLKGAPTADRKKYLGYFRATMQFAETIMSLELSPDGEPLAGSLEDVGGSPPSTSPSKSGGLSKSDD